MSCATVNSYFCGAGLMDVGLLQAVVKLVMAYQCLLVGGLVVKS